MISPEIPSVPSDLERGSSDRLLDNPNADLILRSRERQEFRVQKLYITQSSPVLSDMM